MLRIVVLLIAFLAVTKVFSLEAPIPGYRVVDMHWSVDAFGNGTIIHIPGPVQNVYKELQKINPTLVENINLDTAASRNTNSSLDIISPGNDTLPENQDSDPNPYCPEHHSHDYCPAQGSKIIDGIEYLRRVPGKPNLDAGPKWCSRVSCSWGSGIWICNDSKKKVKLANFSIVADCAQTVYNTCLINEDLGRGLIVEGAYSEPPSKDWNCQVMCADC